MLGSTEKGDMEQKVQAKRGRGGRPPAASAGDVEARLLAAATRLFLERGYDGTSCDQVALDAHAGKASIYARYANKAALFAAVIDRSLAGSLAQHDVPTGMPLDARLALVVMRVLEDALAADALALLRLLVAELPRLDRAGAHADQLFWMAGVKRVAAAITLGDRADAGFDAALPVATRCVELVLAPLLLRALLGEAVAPLLASAPARIAAAISLLHATGGLDEWV
jgi:AcrR family transcriptional regulator